MADDPHALEHRLVAGPPVVQQVVEHGVEVLLRRVPGLHQIVVEAHLVDRLDGRIGIGIGGKQHAPGVGVEFHRLGQELDARHSRHALVDHEQRYDPAAELQFPECLQRFRPGRRAHHLVIGAVVPPQVAGDRREDRRFVVDGEDHGFLHSESIRCLDGL